MFAHVAMLNFLDCLPHSTAFDR